MKALPLLAAAATLLAGQAFAVGEGYTNFVRQQQQTTKVVWDMMGVSAKDSSASQLTLEAGGALFQLWTIQSATSTAAAKDYLLDSKTVGAYLPTATVTVKTADPYTRVPRTRADQPFTVTVNVQGLKAAGVGVPEAATKVLLEQHLAPYPKGTTSIDPQKAISGTPLKSSYIVQNDDSKFDFARTSLAGTDPTQILGEEHFVVHALADGTITQTQIARGFVQIWPVADGAISGMKNGDIVRFKGPDLTVAVNNLYPSSTTWLQIYGGAPQYLNGKRVLVPDAKRLPSSQLVWDSDVSKSTVLTVTNYDSLMPSDGAYTMELLTQTPFGIEILSTLTFNVNRSLEVHSLLGSYDEK